MGLSKRALRRRMLHRPFSPCDESSKWPWTTRLSIEQSDRSREDPMQRCIERRTAGNYRCWSHSSKRDFLLGFSIRGGVSGLDIAHVDVLLTALSLPAFFQAILGFLLELVSKLVKRIVLNLKHAHQLSFSLLFSFLRLGLACFANLLHLSGPHHLAFNLAFLVGIDHC